MQQSDKFTDQPVLRPAGQTAITDQPPPGSPGHTDADGYRTAPDQTNTGWPPGVPYIVGNEACERFSFYGMRAILFVHLSSLYATQVWNHLGTPDSPKVDKLSTTSATAAVHLFIAGVYALPMIGALIADRLA